MEIDEKLKKVMSVILGVPPSAISPSTNVDNTRSWDSLHTMRMIVALEEEFKISIGDADLMEFTSYPAVKKIVEKSLGG